MDFPGDEFYISAFWELNTCRSTGWSIGPIPWRDIIAFAQFAGLDREVLSMFVRVIRAMDNSYIQWVGRKKTT